MAMMSRSQQDGMGWRILGWTLDALVAVLILVTAAGTRTMIRIDKTLQAQQSTQTHLVQTLDRMQVSLLSHESRMDDFDVFRARTEANRFTIEDGEKLVAQDLELWKSIASVKEYIAKIPLEAPPQWFKEEFDELKQEVKELRYEVYQQES